MASEPFLNVSGLCVRYGKITAVNDVSLQVERGEAVALLGANGSGKSTLINAVSGFLKPVAGTIRVNGRPLEGKRPRAFFEAGLAQVSQGRDLFTSMTVAENLELGAPPLARDKLAARLAPVFAYFPRLVERSRQRARSLSGGEQQMLAIGRALMAAPRMLLLDEPSAGLAPKAVDEIAKIVAALKSRGATMLLVEQNLGLAARIADRYYVMRAGTIVHTGSGAELYNDHADFVRRFYL